MVYATSHLSLNVYSLFFGTVFKSLVRYKNSIACFITIQFWKFFKYSGFNFQICDLEIFSCRKFHSFHSFNGVFEEQSSSPCYICFILRIILYISYLWDLSLTRGQKDFLICFPSKSFQSFGVLYSVYDPFWVDFCIWYEVWMEVIFISSFFLSWSSVVLPLLIEKIVSVTDWLCTLVENQLMT